MHHPFQIYRRSYDRILQDTHLERMRRAVEWGREFLNNNPMPDTFAGRKTQEPFPKALPENEKLKRFSKKAQAESSEEFSH
jgi:hypothetical protein